MVVIAEENCIKCGVCLEVCPRGVFQLDTEGFSRVEQAIQCIECGACELNCRGDAINAKAEGCGCLTYILKKRFRGLLGRKQTSTCSC
jgi:NAD-dependent dihydropyrimidine dehydrogenase PreA subunit